MTKSEPAPLPKDKFMYIFFYEIKSNQKSALFFDIRLLYRYAIILAHYCLKVVKIKIDTIN